MNNEDRERVTLIWDEYDSLTSQLAYTSNSLQWKSTRTDGEFVARRTYVVQECDKLLPKIAEARRALEKEGKWGAFMIKTQSQRLRSRYPPKFRKGSPYASDY